MKIFYISEIYLYLFYYTCISSHLISSMPFTNCVHTAAGESVKIRSGRPANDAVERFVEALTIERLVLYLKEPKRKQAYLSCADWSQVGYKLTSLNILIVKVRNWSMERAL